MNWKHYKTQIEKDLKRWAQQGWVTKEASAHILADIDARAPASQTTSWLTLTGIVLAGIAVIAFIADNWAAIPRILKLVVLITFFWASLAGAIWADGKGRRQTVNGLTVLASLVFAASLGLLGQSFNMSGNPTDTLLFGALGAYIMSIAGRSSGAGMIGLVLSAIWYLNVSDGFLGFGTRAGWGSEDLIGGGLLLLAAVGAFVCQSRILLHGFLAMAGPYILSQFVQVVDNRPGPLVASVIWAGIGLAAGLSQFRTRIGAATVAGWAAWHTNLCFALAAIAFDEAIAHRLIWMALAIGTLALGSQWRQGWVVAAGVVSLVTAGFVLLVDLGVALSAAALIFALAAAGAGLLAWLMRSKRDQGE